MAIYCTEYERHSYEQDRHWNALPNLVPAVEFHTRVKDELGNFHWEVVSTFQLFAKKRVLVFALPGAFTPTCSTYQLPSFEQLAEDFYCEGIDDIYCITVNDAFVCNAWAKANNLEHIEVIPDGSAKFTEQMNMLVDKDNLGFGRRSWRYAFIADNGHISDWFIEEGREDNHDKDPYLYTNPDYILTQLRGGN